MEKLGSKFLDLLKKVKVPSKAYQYDLPALRAAAKQRRLDRLAYRKGEKYVDIGETSKNFNPSGFLRGAPAPTKKG